MEKRMLTLIVVALLGVALGVAIVGRKAQDPVLQEILQQQVELKESHNRVEKQMILGGASGSTVTRQQFDQLARRVTELETKLKNLGQLANAGAAPQRQGPPPEDLTKQYEIPVGDSYVRGSQDAKVMVVEFVDFECPFCARFHPPLVEAVSAYKPEQVSYMIKNFPLSFHPNARPAAKAALAAGEQGKYYEMTDLILSNGRGLNADAYLKFAEQLNLNVEQFKQDLVKKDAQYDQIIQDDLELGAAVDVRGTPTFYINGQKTRARDAAGLKREIDQILNN